MSPTLDGTGRAADDLWLLAHDDVTGKPYVQPRPLGLGLAGGLLAELALAGAVHVRHDHITVVAVRRRPADVLLAQVLGQLEGEADAHPVGEWLAYLARTAPAEVAARLAACGYLARDRGLLPWRHRWVPTDRDSAFAPVLRVRAVLDAGRPLTVEGVVLAGLADACGLGFRLAYYAPGRPVRPLHQAIAQLPPGLGDLIAHTKAAVDSAVLAHRV
jgi:Golgi phosphoprotein 3 (GPP34)